MNEVDELKKRNAELEKQLDDEFSISGCGFTVEQILERDRKIAPTKVQTIEAQAQTTEILVLADLAAELMGAKAAKKKAEEAQSAANKEIERIEQILIEQMAAQDIERFGAHGFLFFPIVQQNPAVNKELESEFFAWLEEKGESGIAKLTIHPQTLKAWYRENADAYAEELSEKKYLSVFERIRIGTRTQK